MDIKIKDIMDKYGLEDKFSNRMACKEIYELGNRNAKLKLLVQLQNEVVK